MKIGCIDVDYGNSLRTIGSSVIAIMPRCDKCHSDCGFPWLRCIYAFELSKVRIMQIQVEKREHSSSAISRVADCRRSLGAQ